MRYTSSLAGRVRSALARQPHRRLLVGLAAAASLAVALAACGSSGDGETNDGDVTLEVTMWDSAEATGLPTTKAIIEKFERAHPNIKISLQSIPFSDFEQKLLLQIRSGQAPDVIQTFGNYTADFAAAGALAPLDDLAGSDYKSQMPPELLETGMIDGDLVTVPWAVQPVGLWYNRKLLRQAGLDPDEPPATVDELMRALATVKSKLPGVIPMGIDSTVRVFALDVNWPWLQAFGADPFADGGENADGDGMKAYLAFMQELGRKGYTEVNQKIGYFRPIAADNKVAFIVDQSILEAVIKATDTELTDEQFNETWGVTTLPAAGQSQSFSVPQDHQLSIMKASEHQEEAWTFVEWMTRSTDGDIHVLTNKAAFPAAEELPPAAAKLVEGNPSLQYFRDEITPTIVRPPWGPDYAKGFDPIMVGVQQVMTSDRPVDSVAEEIKSSLRGALGD